MPDPRQDDDEIEALLLSAGFIGAVLSEQDLVRLRVIKPKIIANATAQPQEPDAPDHPDAPAPAFI